MNSSTGNHSDNVIPDQVLDGASTRPIKTALLHGDIRTASDDLVPKIEPRITNKLLLPMDIILNEILPFCDIITVVSFHFIMNSKCRKQSKNEIFCNRLVHQNRKAEGKKEEEEEEGNDASLPVLSRLNDDRDDRENQNTLNIADSSMITKIPRDAMNRGMGRIECCMEWKDDDWTSNFSNRRNPSCSSRRTFRRMYIQHGWSKEYSNLFPLVDRTLQSFQQLTFSNDSTGDAPFSNRIYQDDFSPGRARAMLMDQHYFDIDDFSIVINEATDDDILSNGGENCIDQQVEMEGDEDVEMEEDDDESDEMDFYHAEVEHMKFFPTKKKKQEQSEYTSECKKYKKSNRWDVVALKNFINDCFFTNCVEKLSDDHFYSKPAAAIESKLEKGRLKLDRHQFAVRTVVMMALGHYREDATSEQGSFQDLSPRLNGRCCADHADRIIFSRYYTSFSNPSKSISQTFMEGRIQLMTRDNERIEIGFEIQSMS